MFLNVAVSTPHFTLSAWMCTVCLMCVKRPWFRRLITVLIVKVFLGVGVHNDSVVVLWPSGSSALQIRDLPSWTGLYWQWRWRWRPAREFKNKKHLQGVQLYWALIPQLSKCLKEKREKERGIEWERESFSPSRSMLPVWFCFFFSLSLFFLSRSLPN